MSIHVVSDSTGEVFTFEENQIEWEQTGADEDREMGSELFYTGTIAFEANDGTTVTYIREESEYPIGSPRDAHAETVEGGKLI